jgi:hypothetical protein
MANESGADVTLAGQQMKRIGRHAARAQRLDACEATGG